LCTRLLLCDAARRGLGAVRERDFEVHVWCGTLLVLFTRSACVRRIARRAHSGDPKWGETEANVRDAHTVLRGASACKSSTRGMHSR
jgi:hypothetical protein